MSESWVSAVYLLQTQDPAAALRGLTRGQSVGNPDVLTAYETKAFLDHWQAQGKLLSTRTDGTCMVRVRWPTRQFGREGISYLLSVLMGGHCDLDVIRGCRLMELDVGHLTRFLSRPRYGIQGLRNLLGIQQRALVGGILKPKIGLRPAQVADLARQLADGGCDVIKEDELLADQSWCSMTDRLPRVAAALKDFRVLYLCCITGDGSEVWKKARRAQQLGAGAVHLNLWSGLGVYRDVRRHCSLPLFFQKSGDKVWTTGPFAIETTVLYQLIPLLGCDIAHVGMYGGYLSETVTTLRHRLEAMAPTLPSFSCGMTPSLAEQIIERFGIDLMVTSGGHIHAHPSGPTEGARALRTAAEAASARVLSAGVDHRQFSSEPGPDPTRRSGDQTASSRKSVARPLPTSGDGV